MNPGSQSEPGEVIESVTSHYSRSNLRTYLQVYIGTCTCMKEKKHTHTHTHTHIPKKRQTNYLQKNILYIQESKVISVKSNNQSFISLSKFATQAKSVKIKKPKLFKNFGGAL